MNIVSLKIKWMNNKNSPWSKDWLLLYIFFTCLVFIFVALVFGNGELTLYSPSSLLGCRSMGTFRQLNQTLSLISLGKRKQKRIVQWLLQMSVSNIHHSLDKHSFTFTSTESGLDHHVQTVGLFTASLIAWMFMCVATFPWSVAWIEKLECY